MKRLLLFAALFGLLGGPLQAQDTLMTFTFSSGDMSSITTGVCSSSDMIDGGYTYAHSFPSYYSYATWNRIADSATLYGESFGSTYPYINSWGLQSTFSQNLPGYGNGFILASMIDYNWDHGNSGLGTINAYVTFPAVTLPTNTQIVDVAWTQLYRKYYDYCFVDYKIDSNWYSMEVNVTGIDVDVNTWAPVNVHYTLPLAAAQQSSLQLRLRYFSDHSRGSAYGYLWAVDDFSIIKGNPNQWQVNPEHFVDGKYNVIPQGMQIPLTWYNTVKNTGAVTQTGVNVTMQHTSPTGATTNYISEAMPSLVNHGLADTLIIDPRGFYNSSYPGWFELGPNYGMTSISPISNNGLPTTDAGLNRVQTTAASDSLSHQYNEYNYTVSTADSNGVYPWGFGNGILAGGIGGFTYGYSSDGYITTDTYDNSYNMGGHTVLVRLTTGNTLPVDVSGQPFVFRGVEMVVSPTCYAEGADLIPILWKVVVNEEGSVNFQNVGTGISTYTVTSDDYTLLDSGYLMPGQYNTLRIMFPGQPVLEPNTSYLIGYRLANDADFSLAYNASYYVSYDEDGNTYTHRFREDSVLAPYAHLFQPDYYDVGVYSYSQIEGGNRYMWSGYNIDEFPMISALVGPEVEMPKTTVTMNATGASVYSTINDIGYYGTGATDTVVIGSDASYTITPEAGYEISDILIDGLSMLDWENNFEYESWANTQYLYDSLGRVTEAYNQTAYSYTFHGISAAHTITVTTVPLTLNSITVDCADSNITCSQVYMGDSWFYLDRCGTHSYYGSGVTYFFFANEGYKIDYLLVDGDTIWSGDTWYELWLELNTDHTVKAVSREIEGANITIVNEGNGYIWNNNNSSRIQGTTNYFVTDNEGELSLQLVSFSPIYYYYGYYTDTNATMLTHLYVDGVELPLNNNYSDSNCYLEFTDNLYDGLLIYDLHLYSNNDHTVRAVYGSWSEPCIPVNNHYAEQIDNNNTLLHFYSNSNPNNYSISVEQMAWDDVVWEYVPTGVTYSYVVPGSDNSLTLTGLQPHYQYRYTIISNCDSTTNASVSGEFYQDAMYTITVINNGNGLAYDDWSWTRIYDTMSFSGSENSYRCFYFYTLDPTHPNFINQSTDSSAAQLVALYVDGEEIIVDELFSDDLLENDGYINYWYCLDFDTNHTIEAVYGPYGSGCTSVRNLAYDNSSDTAITITWSAPISGPQTYYVDAFIFDPDWDTLMFSAGFMTDSNFITLTGLNVGYHYTFAVSVYCSDSSMRTQWIDFYQYPHYNVTVINNNGGLLSDNYSGAHIYDTITYRMEYGANIGLNMASLNPTYYNLPDYGLDSSNSMLTHLRVNGQEITLSSATDGLDVSYWQNEYNDNTEIYYYYYPNVYGDMTIEAEFGPWGTLCHPVRSIYYTDLTDSTVTIQWYDDQYSSHQNYLIALVDLTTNDVSYYTKNTEYFNYSSFTGLVPGNDYKVLVYAACDSTTYSLPVSIEFTTPNYVYYPMTFINTTGGYFWMYSDDIDLDLPNLVNTMTVNVPGDNWYIVQMAEFDPSSEYFGMFCDSSNAVLSHFYVDGVEVPISNLYSYYYEGEGVTLYLYNFYADGPHTFEVEYAPLGSAPVTCNTPTDLVNETNGTNAHIEWNGRADAYSLTLTQYDTLENVVGSVTYIVHGTDTTITDLEPNTHYYITLMALCGTMTSGTTSDDMYTGGAYLTFTLRNPDMGYMTYNNGSYLVDSLTTLEGYAISDTAWYGIQLASFLPTSPIYVNNLYQYIDTNALRLTSLFYDGVQLSLTEHLGPDYYFFVNDVRDSLDDDGNAYGYIVYSFYIPINGSHDVLAHFSSWSDTTSVITIDTFTVTLNVNDPTMGVVTGAGRYTDGSIATISAVANNGYHFVTWSDSVSLATRTLSVTSDITLTAFFAMDTVAIVDTFTVTLNVNDPTMGTVTGAGRYTVGSWATIGAVPNNGYRFDNWSDGDTMATRSFIVINDVSLTANFSAIPIDTTDTTVYYTVSAVAADPTTGTVTGAGRYAAGDIATLTAVANNGYHFVNWNDGSTAEVRAFAVTCDTSFVANFAIDTVIPIQTFTVTLSVNDEAMGVVTGAGIYNEGDTATIGAVANQGFHFVRWNDGVLDATRTIVVTSDTSFMAFFVSDSIAPDTVFTLTLLVNDSVMGTVEGAGIYHAGDNVTISAMAYPGYRFVNWSDGDTLAVRTIILTSDSTITAIFVADSTQGINDIELSEVNVYAQSLQIFAQGSVNGETVTLYTVDGRRIESRRSTGIEVRFNAPASGLYLVQFGNRAVRRVVVVR